MSNTRLHSRAAATTAGRSSCVTRLAGTLLVLVSLGLLVWNFSVRTPFDDPTVRPAVAAQFASPHAKVHPYSVNTFLAHEVEEWRREKTIEMIAEANIGWIKQQFLWSQIEPARDSHWDAEYQQDAWKKYDEIVDLAESYGIRVIARLDHTPPWARPDGTDYHTPPTDVEDYGRFVGKFVEQYRGRVQHIQIWNEPNLSREWGGEIDPEGYFELLRSAYTHAKDADPDVVVLSAPMAMTNEYSERAIPEYDFWTQLYELGAQEYFDVLTATGFGIEDPPEVAPEGDTINLRRTELLREIMAQYNDLDTAIWLTEFGWNAPPSSVPDEDLLWGRVSATEQADWTARGIQWMDEHWDWFGVASIWYLRQTGVIPPSAPEYYFAMVDLEFTPRPVYLAVSDAASESRVALPGIYGPMESPVKPLSPWSRQSDADSPFEHVIVSSEPGASLEIVFSGTDLSLQVGAEHVSFGQIEVLIDGRSPQDDRYFEGIDGRSYLDIGEHVDDQGWIEIVRGYGADRPQQEHTATIVLGDGSSMAVAGIEVEYERSYAHFVFYTLIGISGMLMGGLLFRR